MKRDVADTTSRPAPGAVDAESNLVLLHQDTPRRPSSVETLSYLIEITVELKELATNAGFKRLGLILLLAEQEARQQSGKLLG